MTPYYQDDACTIYHGDCLDVMSQLTSEVQAVVMDPPYASGARTEVSKPRSGQMLRGMRFARPIENDQMTTPGFVWLMREVGQVAYQLLPDGGSLLSFIDWRSWVSLLGALESVNYRVNDMVVWDKASFGMGHVYRKQHELIMHTSKGVATVYDRSVGTVIRTPRQLSDDHPAPKPVGLLERLLRPVTMAGQVVLDPFMGCGPTLQAAKDLGRKAIGIEIEERYCEIAAKRLAQEVLAL